MRFRLILPHRHEMLALRVQTDFCLRELPSVTSGIMSKLRGIRVRKWDTFVPWSCRVLPLRPKMGNLHWPKSWCNFCTCRPPRGLGFRVQGLGCGVECSGVWSHLDTWAFLVAFSSSFPAHVSMLLPSGMLPRPPTVSKLQFHHQSGNGVLYAAQQIGSQQFGRAHKIASHVH